MTAPREIVPGRLYFITRRCTQRQFLLRPDETTSAIFAYCLAEAAERYGIKLVAWLAMSNHYHAVVYDPKGRLPAFLEHFHKMVAKALNVRWDRWENLWSSEETCVTYLPTPTEVFEKVVYVLANPLEQHLVDRLAHWPGCSSFAQLDGKPTKHDRPDQFFSKTGRMPESAKLRVDATHATAKGESTKEWTARVREAIAVKERAIQAEVRRGLARIVGRKAILSASAFSSPKTEEPRRQLRPAVACKNREERIHHLGLLKAFRFAYREARRLFSGGNRRAVFPAGTYKLRSLGVRCGPSVA